MIGFRDQTYCVSPGCENKCGRKLTPEVVDAARKWWGTKEAPLTVGFFCGEPPRTPVTPKD